MQNVYYFISSFSRIKVEKLKFKKKKIVIFKILDKPITFNTDNNIFNL